MHNQMFTLVPYFILTVWILLLAMIVFVLISNWRCGKKIAADARSRGWPDTKNGKRALARYPETHPFSLCFGYSYSEGSKNKRRVDSVRRLFGARDTQFESGRFSDEKFTHGVVHPQMMTWLMKHPGRNFTLSAELLMSFYRNIPGFVWQEPSAPGQQQGAAP